MSSILFILLGIGIWQFITFIVLIVSNEDEDMVMKIGCGIPLIIVNSIMLMLRTIRRIHIRKNYVVAHIYNEKGADDKPFFLQNVRVKKNTLQNYYTKGENKYYIEEFTPRGKYIENEDNIKKVRKNGWFCQKWVDENLLK